MDYVAEQNPLDEVVEQDGAKVFIAPMAQMFLIGTEIDYEMDLLQAGFKFRNPNVAEACGCGESIKFKDAPAVESGGPPSGPFHLHGQSVTSGTIVRRASCANSRQAIGR
jgi:hypothetical protein